MSNSQPLISVVTPVYRPGGVLEKLFARVRDTLEAHVSPDFEFIMVDDRSPDNAWEEIRQVVEKDPRARGFRLSRNFGQHHALTAGLDQARGEWIIIMDCDLQDIPEEIPKLYAKAQEGYDVVLAQRLQRQDSWMKTLNSRMYYAVFGYLTDTKPDPTTANYGIYHRKVIDTILGMRERMRFLPALISWIGFNKTAIPVQHGGREIGISNYSFKRLLLMALDTIIAFSDKPLRLTIKLGFAISLFSILLAILVVVNLLVRGDHTPLGWTSQMVAITFFSGLIIFIIGIHGLYLSRIFEEVKRRPLYILDKTCIHPAASWKPEVVTYVTGHSQVES